MECEVYAWFIQSLNTQINDFIANKLYSYNLKNLKFYQYDFLNMFLCTTSKTIILRHIKLFGFLNLFGNVFSVLSE